MDGLTGNTCCVQQVAQIALAPSTLLASHTRCSHQRLRNNRLVHTIAWRSQQTARTGGFQAFDKHLQLSLPPLRAFAPDQTFVSAAGRQRACLWDRFATLLVRDSFTDSMSDRHTPQRVEFNNPSSGEKLVGVWLNLEGSDQAVVLCHGYASSKDGFHMQSIQEELAERQVSSLRFDFSGNGESEGTFVFGNYRHEVGDLRAAVQFVRSQGLEVKAVLGHSKAGTVVLLYAAAYDDTPLVVNVCGRFHQRAGVEQYFGADIHERLEKEGQVEQRHPKTGAVWMLTKQDMQERLTTDMVAADTAIKCSKVLTVHGTADETIPVADAHEHAAHLANHTLRLVDGADHGFTDPRHAEAAIQLIVDFVTSS